MKRGKTPKDELVGQNPGRLQIGIYLYDPADDFDAFRVIDHSTRPGAQRGWWCLLNEITMHQQWFRGEDLATLAYLPKRKWPIGGPEAQAI